MHARVSFYELGQASRDDVVRGFESVRGVVEQMQGNQGGMVLVNPHGGKAMTITLWESEDALRATEHLANQARQESASAAGLTISGVEAYEVVTDFRR